MRVSLSSEVMYMPEGQYTGKITDVKGYNNDENILVKIQIDEGSIFVKFYAIDDFVKYGWSDVLRALKTDDTDNLIDQQISFEIVNGVSKTTGNEFSNIRKIKLLSKKYQ